jgi:hypothetical protein
MAMEKRKPNEAADGEAVANPDSTPEQPRRIDLPAVESPSISPVELGQATDSVTTSSPEEAEISSIGTARTTSFSLVEFTAPKRPRFAFRPRHKRYALLAASVAIAAVVGAVTGAATTGGFSKAPPVAAIEENKAMQQSVARLTKEITSLKATLDAANRSASSQIAKISERLSRETTNVTGSVPPQTQAAPTGPLPAARPETAATAMQPRLSIVPDWTIHDTRDGFVYVQGHGDIYQVVPGAPLPGLGPVEQIKRQDGRWLVVTPKGIIVSMRDRRYFEQF